MELMQLEMFVAVVESGSVRAAAERVFRTQPAVSIAMRKLKEELGAPVFDRPKRYAYQLTPVGKELYSYAKRMLSLRSETLVAIENICKLSCEGDRTDFSPNGTRPIRATTLVGEPHSRYKGRDSACGTPGGNPRIGSDKD
jgi:hypothetical protein